MCVAGVVVDDGKNGGVRECVVAVVADVAADDGGTSITITSKSKLDGIHFHHFSCLRDSATALCNNCSLNLNVLVDLCRKAAQT